jgi:lipopolysaccharide/colanic/teichoic acid biosynthesis glycosyltransferase
VLKRALDILVAAGVLLALWPLFVLIAVAVWLDSGGPVFFSQERIGRGFGGFRIRKFRSMRPANRGPAITAFGDQRVTRAGRVLRACKLDELPQFWNVLIGEMSLVGPRPEVPEYVDLHRERYATILSVRPGITDLASIRFRNEERILSAAPDPLGHYREALLPSKLDLAEMYVKTRSFGLDCRILFQTVLVTLMG